MKFNEAMENLQSGLKVTREAWKQDVYFKIEDKEVKSYQPKLMAYIYNEDIMISEGWFIEGMESEFKFSEIIDSLSKGNRAKLKDCKDSYIYLDFDTKSLVCRSMEAFPFVLQFTDFMAEDWIVIV